MNYSAVELSGDAPVFYTPPKGPESSNFGPIWDLQGRVQRDSGTIAVEYTWTLPPEPSDMPILLFFNQPELNGFAGELTAGFEGAGDYVVVEGDTVVLRLELTEAGWRGSINGEALPASATDRLSGGQLSQPAFYSQRHGLHTVTTEVFGDDAYISGTEGEKTKTISYFQKGLAFTEPLPEPDPDNPDEPLPIENTVVWSDGSELLDEDVSWSVRVPDDVIGGDGTEISVFWDPLRQTFNEILNRAPTDEELEEIEVTKFEELDMSIEARTRVYEEKEADGYPSLQYVLRKNFSALGANEFHIVNAKVLPEEPFTEEEPFAELEADIVLVGPDPANYDVTWFVEIKNPDGEIVVSELQSGQGYQVYAFWDGIVDGELVEGPETYQFHIRVEACEGDGGGGAFRAISAQENPILECLGEVAQTDVPMRLLPTLRVYGDNRSKVFEARSDLRPTAERLNEVYTEGTLTFELSGTALSLPQEQSEVTIILDSNKSPGLQGHSLVLQRISFDKFEAEFDLSALQENYSTPATSDIDSQAYYTCDTSGSGSDARIFSTFFGGRNQVQLGRSFGSGDPTSILAPSTITALSDNLDETTPTQSSFRAMGYEVIEAKLSEPAISTSDVVKVRFRYKNQAPLCYFSGDGGSHAQNRIAIPGGQIAASDLSPQDFQKVRTLILAGCPNLDINDYNNAHPSSTDTVSASSPGLQWDSLFPSQSTGAVGASGNLLGYNAHPPTGDSTQQQILERFLKILDSRRFQNNADMLDEVALA